MLLACSQYIVNLLQGMDLSVVPLHKYPQHIMQCCDLINDEWKRSTTARLRSLEGSCDTLPTCLILLQNDKVIGHCKLSPILSIRDACFVESVVIDRVLRGQGFGKYLMKRAEEYCKNALHLQTIYLSTKGQEAFYSKIGYSRCQPVSIYGGCSAVSFSNQEVKDVKRTTIQSQNSIPVPPPIPAFTVNFANVKVYMKKDL